MLTTERRALLDMVIAIRGIVCLNFHPKRKMRPRSLLVGNHSATWRNGHLSEYRQQHFCLSCCSCPYMDASYRYPDFLVPDYEEIKKDPKRLIQYKLYVSHLLWSYDEVFSALTEGWLEQFLRFINNGFRNRPVDDYSWRGAFYTDIEFHLAGLCEFADKKFFSEFGSYTERLVISAMKNSSAASCKHRFQVD
jgi:hypothetical protein